MDANSVSQTIEIAMASEPDNCFSLRKCLHSAYTGSVNVIKGLHNHRRKYSYHTRVDAQWASYCAK